MKRTTRMWLAVGALAALAGLALADNNVLNHGTYYSNGATGAKTNSTGDASNAEAFPAMDANLTFSNLIINNTLTLGSGDSSLVKDTHRMRLGTLYIKALPNTGVGSITRLAVQVRSHLFGVDDSLDTFAWHVYGQSQLGISATLPDTVNVGHLAAGSATAPWSSEFVVTIDRQHNGPNGAASATFFYPEGIAIPLSSIFGRDVYSPYTSIRVRNLVGPTVSVTVHLVGTPL